jgi:ferredoxin
MDWILNGINFGITEELPEDDVLRFRNAFAFCKIQLSIKYTVQLSVACCKYMQNARYTVQSKTLLSTAWDVTASYNRACAEHQQWGTHELRPAVKKALSVAFQTVCFMCIGCGRKCPSQAHDWYCRRTWMCNVSSKLKVFTRVYCMLCYTE